jgi:hypothetical protein
MFRIYKYPLDITDVQYLEMPTGAKLLSAGYQGATLCLWAHVNPDAKAVLREVHICGTGHACHSGSMNHIDTVIDDVGLVWHVFDGRTERDVDSKAKGGSDANE